MHKLPDDSRTPAELSDDDSALIYLLFVARTAIVADLRMYERNSHHWRNVSAWRDRADDLRAFYAIKRNRATRADITNAPPLRKVK